MRKPAPCHTFFFSFIKMIHSPVRIKHLRIDGQCNIEKREYEKNSPHNFHFAKI